MEQKTFLVAQPVQLVALTFSFVNLGPLPAMSLCFTCFTLHRGKTTRWWRLGLWVVLCVVLGCFGCPCSFLHLIVSFLPSTMTWASCPHGVRTCGKKHKIYFHDAWRCEPELNQENALLHLSPARAAPKWLLLATPTIQTLGGHGLST